MIEFNMAYGEDTRISGTTEPEHLREYIERQEPRQPLLELDVQSYAKSILLALGAQTEHSTVLTDIDMPVPAFAIGITLAGEALKVRPDLSPDMIKGILLGIHIANQATVDSSTATHGPLPPTE